MIIDIDEKIIEDWEIEARKQGDLELMDLLTPKELKKMVEDLLRDYFS